MNGRVYDPYTAKFLSADPLVSDPTNGQNYNRYSYVLNNPTNLTDPTGFCPQGTSAAPGSAICRDNLVVAENSKGELGIYKEKDTKIVKLDSGGNEKVNVKSLGGTGVPGKEGKTFSDTVSQSSSNGMLTITQHGKWSSSNIGAPGFGESLIPVWGSGRQAIYDFQTGHYGWGLVNTGLAVSDVFLVKSLATGLAKGAWKVGSNTWGATRKWYGATRELPPGTQVHHWAIEQNSEIGKMVPDVIKNQPWNLNPIYATEEMSSQQIHTAIHGKGLNPYNAFGRWWYGTPDWAKNLEVNVAGKAASHVGDN